jgi:hypothetical protein
MRLHCVQEEGGGVVVGELAIQHALPRVIDSYPSHPVTLTPHAKVLNASEGGRHNSSLLRVNTTSQVCIIVFVVVLLIFEIHITSPDHHTTLKPCTSTIISGMSRWDNGTG